jgi:hypothetical protein
MEVNQWNFRAFAIYNIKPRNMELLLSNLKCSAWLQPGKKTLGKIVTSTIADRKHNKRSNYIIFHLDQIRHT